jgi:hypothetical protein
MAVTASATIDAQVMNQLSGSLAASGTITASTAAAISTNVSTNGSLTGNGSTLGSGTSGSALSSASPSGTATNSGIITTNPNYQITLTQNGTNLMVVGNAPQDFELNLHNNYVDLLTLLNPLLGGGGTGGALLSAAKTTADVVTNVATLTGTSLSRIATVQIWTGTTPLSFTIPISFRAFSSPLNDVIQPLLTLIQMGSPTDGGGGLGTAILNSPGPSLVDMGKAITANPSGTVSSWLSGLNKAITMQMGSNMVVPGLVIEGLHIKWGMRADRATGLPVAAEATVSFKTVVSFSQQDVLGMFQQNGQALAGTSVVTAPSSAANAATSLGKS